MENQMKIGFIGAGNMGTAILKGIAGSPMAQKTQLYVYDCLLEKAQQLKEYGVQVCTSAAEVAKTCKFVFLAIKPQQFGSLLPELRPVITEDTVIVSIAAGITAEYIRSETIPNAKVVLVMPNTPLLLGVGATALACCPPATEEEFSVVRQIFDACGVTAVVKPNQMKEIIAINGSSPAFIYLFAKGFMDYAKQVGISESVALPLFAQSLTGAAKMLTDSGMTMEELIRMVSSPGGTTLAGLDALYEGKLTEIVGDACNRCTKRAYELSK
ncbi:MAG: pyrroline-5-carboxylate reductase [Ruminococcus sp.]